MSLFDYDEEGHSIVIADQRELLVHDGASEAPRWRAESQATLVGVGSNAISIVSLDDVGVLTIWSHETATVVKSANLAVPATALASDFLGRCAAVHPGGVVVAVGGEPRSFGVVDASCAAFGPEGQLLVGTKSGELHVLGYEGAAPARVVRLEEAINDIAWNAQGFYMVASGGAVYRLDGIDISRVTNAPDGMAVRSIECSASGDRVALLLDDKMALVLAYPSRETEGHVNYGDRTVCGMAFGPNDWFGVGMHGGDGNKFDLRTGATHRTDTHPGRDHKSWLLVSAFGEAPPPSAPAATAAPQAAPAPAASSARGNAPPRKGGALKALAVLAVIIGIAIAVVIATQEPTELWVVNALGVPVTVMVDDVRVDLQPESWHPMEIGGGDCEVVVSTAAGEISRETIDVDGGNVMAVYNVLGAAWVFGDTIWYGGSGDRNWELYAFQTFHDIDEERVQLRFRGVPNSTSSSSGVATYRFVGVGQQWGWQYTVSEAHQRLPAAEAAAFEARLQAAQPNLAAAVK